MDKPVKENYATVKIHANIRELMKLVKTGLKYESDKCTGLELIDGINKELEQLDSHLNWRDEMDRGNHGSVDD